VKKIFLDANVIIDFIDPSRARHEKTIQFFQDHIKDYFYTSCDILTTIYYITLKNKNPIDDIENLLNLVDVIPFSNEEALLAIELMKKDKKFKDFEDTMQYVLAKKVNTDIIVTNDKGFYSPDIQILSL
jgi:predicted nucleic acid-binding protein